VTVDLAYVTVAGSTGMAFSTAPGDLAGIGTDTIFGGVNNVRGSIFGDTILGSGASESFSGAAGDDFIDGRGGFDTAVYGPDTAITAGITVDMAMGTVTGDASLGTDTLRSIESIVATNFDDAYVATGYGSAGALNVGNLGTINQFQGLGGNDSFTGNANTEILYTNATAGVVVDLALGTATGDASVGTDTILGGVARVRGSNFADSILGDGNNNNILSGQGGNDRLDGRGGNDTLNGGAGADTFVYTTTANGLDHINDFNGHGGQADVIEFDHLAFGDGLAVGGLNTGMLDASHFVADGIGPTDAAQVFWYNTDDRTLYYDADGNGAGSAIAIAILDNGFVLDHTDLVLV